MKATQAEDRLRRTDAFMCANDKVTLSSGVTTQEASRQAQRAADVIAAWVFQWKMRVAALARTQALVLSQWARDATGLGVMVAADTYLCPLGATFDRLLHFGTHST